MNKRILIVAFKIILLMNVFNSCGQPTLYDKISSHVNKNCELKDTCYLSLKDITDFNWDKVYIISIGTDPSQILGFKYPFFEDIAERIIFLKEDKIVYHEDIFPDPEKIPELIFCVMGNEQYINDYDYMMFSPDESFFYIKRTSSQTYLLYPMSCK